MIAGYTGSTSAATARWKQHHTFGHKHLTDLRAVHSDSMLFAVYCSRTKNEKIRIQTYSIINDKCIAIPFYSHFDAMAFLVNALLEFNFPQKSKFYEYFDIFLWFPFCDSRKSLKKK